MIEIYTDGAYNPVLRQGGWGAVIVENNQKRIFSGVAKETNKNKTTSNRMEIIAALEGIRQMPQGAEVVIHTDSQYLFGCMSRGWRRRANLDLWEQMDKAAGQRKVSWEWIEGNNINPFHREAHNLATGLASRSNNPETLVPKGLSHLDVSGSPLMVDVSGKPDTEREATAGARVRMQKATYELLSKGKMLKGNVLVTARLAGIMAAKQTFGLIPLCHPVLIDDIKVEFALDSENSLIDINFTAKSTGKTGVEMEALTAAAVAALTIYDMCKAVDKGMTIENIRLIRKSGGKSGKINLE